MLYETLADNSDEGAGKPWTRRIRIGMIAGTISTLCIVAVLSGGLELVQARGQPVRLAVAGGSASPTMLSDDWIPSGDWGKIRCAYLRMVRPNTSSMELFVRDLALHGLDPTMALQVGSMVLSQQAPELFPSPRAAAASGRAPDIYKLDRAGTISHADRYFPYFSQVRDRVNRLVSPTGRISYRDTIDLKIFVAEQSSTCPISDASKLETRILFIRAGGDLESGTVNADDWLRLVMGLTPVLPGFKVAAGTLGWVDGNAISKVIALEAEAGSWARPSTSCEKQLALSTSIAPVGIQSQLTLSKSVDLSALGSGKIAYPGVLLPDPSKPLKAFSSQESEFALAFDAPLKRSSGTFQVLLRPYLAKKTTEFYDGAQEVINGIVIGGRKPRWLELKGTNDALGITNVQGSRGKWQTDAFASELISNTFLSTFLMKTTGGYALDLSGSEGAAASELQRLKQDVVRSAPANLLRCRALLTTSSMGQLQLSSIDVFPTTESDTHDVISLSPKDGSKWELAKTGMTLYTIECFHTGIHLFSHGAISSVQRSMPPQSSTLAGVVDPSSLFVVAAILEQAAGLHNDHPSMWSGTVWDADIEAVRANTVAIARFFHTADLEEILGGVGRSKSTEWWAGGAHKFIAPIRSFATHMAEVVVTNEKAVLERLQNELSVVGIGECAGCPDVTTKLGLAKFHTNLIYLQSVFHGQLYYCREYISPLGLPSTREVWPALVAEAYPGNIISALDVLFPKVTPSMVAATAILYGTGIGVIEGPELSDGPYLSCDALEGAIQTFRLEVAETRKAIESHFTQRKTAFSPSFFFPKSTPKPLGYGMTQSVYI